VRRGSNWLMRCDAMRCDAMRCDAMRCDAMRFDAMPCYTDYSGGCGQLATQSREIPPPAQPTLSMPRPCSSPPGLRSAGGRRTNMPTADSAPSTTPCALDWHLIDLSSAPFSPSRPLILICTARALNDHRFTEIQLFPIPSWPPYHLPFRLAAPLDSGDRYRPLISVVCHRLLVDESPFRE
jgi:hypothetical protein